MKLSTLTAKLTGGNSKVFSMVGGLALAGAALLVGAPVAGAQQVGFGVQFGGPRYVAPAPPPVYRGYGPAVYGPRPGFEARSWDHRRAEEWRAHEDWARRREYGRPMPYRGYPY